jgi:hypothetical protein
MKKAVHISILLLVIETFCQTLPGQGIIIPSGARVIKSSGYTIIKSGNWTNNGTFTHTGGTLVFSGTTQTLGGSSTATYYNITISSGSTTTISTAGQRLSSILLCNGTLNSNGKLTLASTVTGTALIDGSGIGTVSGNVTMERYLPSGFGYKYFSSAFLAATVNEFADDITLNASFTTFYKYDENRTSSGWVNYKTTTNVLNPLAGYAINFGSNSAPNTADITGVVNNGALSTTLYNHNFTYTRGYNLVGNPYPSPIDWNAASGWTKTNIDNAIYYFKAGLTNQYTGTITSFVPPNISSDGGISTNIIPSMQGFFVHVSNGTYPVTATLGMDNRVRVTDKTHAFVKGEASILPLLRLSATFADNPASPDPCVIYFNEKADVEFDTQLDALKMYNTDLSVPNLFSVTPAGEKLSINALPFSEEQIIVIPLGLKLNKDGFVTFSVRDIQGSFADMRIFLSDKFSGAMQDLGQDNYYEVFLVSGEYLNRFYINAYTSTTDIPEQLPSSTEIFSIYSSQGLLKTEINQLNGPDGTLIINNLLGQTLFTGKVYETGYHEFSPGIKDGVYIATFISGNTKVSKKVFVKN